MACRRWASVACTRLSATSRSWGSPTQPRPLPSRTNQLP
jgi:hypothetical protein